MDLINMDSINGGSPELYDDLVNRIDNIKMEFKAIRIFYDDNKRKLQDQKLLEQWRYRIEELDKKIIFMNQYFEDPQVLHQDMNFKFPYEIIENYFDEQRSLKIYFDEEFQKVSSSMDKNEYRCQNFALLSQMMKETFNK